MTGYIGYLPTADGRPFDPGEKSLSSLKRCLSPLQQEWKEALNRADEQDTFRKEAQAHARTKLLQ
ncbi:hypothetical protein [Deinococcus sp. Marseille-Q6407]|uniref:hypothetical protein n=1 Tax=Deinococcus sp. Marseille-Q6407 TaxID=2969223 RepID=UPI0021BE5C89|nr:hypothetical protein [Deinococcus sp. Marseille-Q6407]